MKSSESLYLGVDVGGTKVAAGLVTSRGNRRAVGRYARLFFVFFFEIKRSRIDAETKAGRLGTVFKNVAKMRVAAAAEDFRASHSMARIALEFHIFGCDRLIVAGPSGA